MARRETKSFREYVDRAKPLIVDLIDKYSFLSLRSVQMLLESKKYWHTVTWSAIKELVKEERLRTAKYPPRGMYPVWVYKYDLRINDIRQDIDEVYKPLYSEFMDTSKLMGPFCEEIVEKALTDAGFVTISRNQNTRYFRGRKCGKRSDVDFIAYKEGIFYGIEVKNQIAYPNWDEDIIKKKNVVDYHGLQFVFVNRVVGPYGYRLFKCGGIYVELESIVWSSKYSSLADKLVKCLHFPIICVDEPCESMVSKIKAVHFLHDKYFYGKGRIS